MDNTQKSPQTYPADSNQYKPFIGKTEALIIGLLLAIAGAIISGSFEKGMLTNYIGFGMILAGITTFVAGTCSILIANIENRVRRENPEIYRTKKRLPIHGSIWTIGAGVILAVLGSILASTYDRALLMNTVGFGMLLLGVGVSVLGFSSAALETVKIELHREQNTKVRETRSLFFNIVLLGLAVVFLVVGTLLAGSYAKDTLLNDAGFGMLIAGVGILCLGTAGTAISILKAQAHNQNKLTNGHHPRVIFGSIWAIGIGTMLLIIGFILSGNFAKNTLINYTGLGMLLTGAGVFVYGLFETAKAFATGYLNYRHIINYKTNKTHSTTATKQHNSFSFHWKNMIRTSSILNLGGIIAAVCILFFSIWQLDIIVSGPVWWSSAEQGSGFGWSHPEGAYANDYFQCFFWKTTIGQAYDTLFMLIFIAFIVMFLSAYFWPKHDRTPLLRLTDRDGEIPAKTQQLDQEKEDTQPTTTTEVNQQIPSITIQEIETHVEY